jgi:hypothetical protein
MSKDRNDPVIVSCQDVVVEQGHYRYSNDDIFNSPINRPQVFIDGTHRKQLLLVFTITVLSYVFITTFTLYLRVQNLIPFDF